MYKYHYTIETYSRTESGKSWKSKPDEVKTGTYTQEQYENCTNEETIKWFRRLGGSEHVTRSYTFAGYIPTRIISSDPSRAIRKVRTFKVEKA